MFAPLDCATDVDTPLPGTRRFEFGANHESSSFAFSAFAWLLQLERNLDWATAPPVSAASARRVGADLSLSIDLSSTLRVESTVLASSSSTGAAATRFRCDRQTRSRDRDRFVRQSRTALADCRATRKCFEWTAFARQRDRLPHRGCRSWARDRKCAGYEVACGTTPLQREFPLHALQRLFLRASLSQVN